MSKEQENKKTVKPSYFFKQRKSELKNYRQAETGLNIEHLWRLADSDYKLTPLSQKKRKRSSGENLREPQAYLQARKVNLDSTSWQSDNSDAVVFSKIQTAISVLFDRNPEAILNPGSEKFVHLTEVAKTIFSKSQHDEDFKDKMKLFVFNLAKYGYAPAKTSIKETYREFEELVSYDPISGKKDYEKKKTVTRKLFFEPLNNWNVWIDENAKPYQWDTINDWMYRKLYSSEQLKAEFGDTQKVNDALSSGSKDLMVLTNQAEDDTKQPFTRSDMNEVFFYENYRKDLVIVEANGIVIYEDKLPVHKKLSLSLASWNIRDDQSIYGIGLPEIIRQDKYLLDKIRNMTVDQLVLSIYKMFFYDGANNSQDSDIKIQPGKGQRILDPSKLKWLDVPSAGREAVEREEMLRANIDESSGITKALGGGLSMDPNLKALALQQSKEASLAKLKTPLDNILFMLRHEAILRWDLIQELNMFPTEAKLLVNPNEVEAYLQEIKSNPEMYHLDPKTNAFYALRYPKIAAHLDLDENGSFVKSETRNFFHVTPSMIRWDGEITFTAESVLVMNKELQRQMDLDMANLIIPLLAGDPKIMMKPVKQILKIYGKDPNEWIPESWLNPTPTEVPPIQPTPGEPQNPEFQPQGGGMETVVPKQEVSLKTDVNQVHSGVQQQIQSGMVKK